MAIKEKKMDTCTFVQAQNVSQGDVFLTRNIAFCSQYAICNFSNRKENRVLIEQVN